MTVLLVTRSTDEHCTPRVEAALRARGAEVFRLDTDRFPGEVQIIASETGRTTLVDGPRRLDLAEVTAVWNRRCDVGARLPLDMPVEMRHAALAEARSLLDDALGGLDVFELDPMAVHQSGGRKRTQLVAARAVGLRVPRTVMTNDPAAVRALAAECPDGIVCKMTHAFEVPTAEGLAVMFTNTLSADDIAALDEGLALCPMTFQEQIAKARELRVVVVDGQVWAAAIDSQAKAGAEVDWRRMGAETIAEWVPVALPGAVEAQLRALMARLGLCYGAVDLIETPGGEYVFLEVNPGGEYFWLEDHCGFAVSDALAARLIAG